MLRLRKYPIVWMVMLMGADALAQQPPKPDPLEGLLSKEVPPAGEVRLHLSVFKLPLSEAAQATLADDGQAPAYWHTTLAAWQAAGKLETVRDFSHQGEPGHRELIGRNAQSFHYLSKDEASHFWDDLLAWEAYRGKPWNQKRDDNELLQSLQQEEIGDAMHAMVGLKFGGLQASLQMTMMISPRELESRPLTTWPLSGVHATRDFFRPWKLMTHMDAPVRQLFLLGSQMEPPQDGQVDTGHVLMAFGCLTPGPEEVAEPSKVPPVRSPLYRVQSWTLAVPLDSFQTWFQTRRDAQGDEAALRSWLKPGALLGTSALASSSGYRASISGDLHWYDASGFEPSFNPTIYCPLSCDGDELYWLRHEMEFDLSVTSSVPNSSGPFADPTEAEVPAEFPVSLELALMRPSAPARWLRGKTAFERTDADDPNALELAEADVYEASESTRTHLSLLPGQVSLVSAGLKDGHVRATFLRVVKEAADPAPGVEKPILTDSSSTLTTWVIETPVSWRERLFSDPAPDLHQLADELISRLGDGEVDCIGLTTRVSDGGSGLLRATHPRLFYGGEYLNTAVHAQGIYFNPRGMDHLSVGTEVESEFNDALRPSWRLSFTQEPQTRHWGIWKPDIASAKAENSGMRHPTQPVTHGETILELTAHQAEVISVIQTSSLGAVQAVKPTLQWHVVRQDPPPKPKGIAPTPPEEPLQSRAQTVQFLLLKTPADLSLPEDGQTAAQQLLKAHREGRAETLECVTLRRSADVATLRSGWDYYYPNGRERDRDVKEADAWKAAEVMPAGTKFSDQINISHRLVGCQWEIRSYRWLLTRDVQAPKIVTDTFSDVIQEWPGPQPDGPEWNQLPRTRVSVQRPIFQVQTSEGELPPAGKSSVSRLSADTVLVVRVLP